MVSLSHIFKQTHMQVHRAQTLSIFDKGEVCMCSMSWLWSVYPIFTEGVALLEKLESNKAVMNFISVKT